MHAFELILVLFTIVLVSSILDQLLSRLSLPLVQIAMGVVGALVIGEPFQMTIDSHLFLVIFIAPLLYDESRRVSKRALMRNIVGILSLAIGLVVASVFAVGFALNWISPSIPLAAGLALGAALGPTDAVAVSALSKSTKLTERQTALLSGEALINDASGIVSFQFAVGAAVTGIFSVANAAGAFAASFGGGLLFGVVMGVVVLSILRGVRGIGLESTVFHVTFEILTPFVIFLLAEGIGVSGILAVVAAGLMIALAPNRATAYTARVSLVSHGVWEVIAFILNGIVFVFLGSHLPSVFTHSWEDATNPLSLAGLVLVLTAIVVTLRFVWVLILDWHMMRIGRLLGVHNYRQLLKGALTTTLGGPKGAVTLSIAMTLPVTLTNDAGVPIRDELIFLASGTILCTLLLANFLLPVLSPTESKGQSQERTNQVRTMVLSNLVEALNDNFGTRYPMAVSMLIGRYNHEIAELTMSKDFDAAIRRLRLNLLLKQREWLSDLLAQGKISNVVFESIGQTIDRLIQVANHKYSSRIGLRRVWMRIVHALKEIRASRSQHDEVTTPQQLRDARIALSRRSVDYLNSLEPKPQIPHEAIDYLLGDNQRLLAMLQRSAQYDEAISGKDHQPAKVGIRARRTLAEQLDLMEAEALRLELGCVQQLLEDDLITRAEASELRDEIYLLQMNLSDYSSH
ncbi:sodium:proton antiporter [Propionimicrobium lymphophilum]|uniref:cation:proton antiporter n=1 Tax=Propionimicrobium lymphophilum TaxID=33012 RepID=UPI00254EBD5F|nr:sodium:proton antiporter [Propionimicrobium lymphophilum]MDK7709783.1 sodium:proton antiporter [Propionimicrobium lymphophilum]MDK7733955.1 sodium:proton antiporter [Propionimicrobium lymphophilum]